MHLPSHNHPQEVVTDLLEINTDGLTNMDTTVKTANKFKAASKDACLREAGSLIESMACWVV